VYLSHLTLTNFRNLAQVELELSPGVVVFFGANAQGKTALLEAIYTLAIARSFRSFIDRYRPAQAYCVNLSLEQKMAVARTTVSFLPWFRLSDTTVELL